METTAGPLEIVFLSCAIGGTIFFVIRFVMLFIGAGDMDVDAGHLGADAGHAGGDMHDGSSSDAHFSVLSINTITAFIMMFGWAGLTCYKQFLLEATPAILIAFLTGVLCMFITAYLFQLAGRLVSRGTSFDIAKMVGQKAGVYQQIPADGRGRVTVNIPGSNTRELEAVSSDKVEIKSFKTVEIVQVIDGNTVSVREVV